MTNNTLQHGLSDNLDDCFVDVEYILYKVVTAKCCWSTYAFNATLTLIPYLRLTCKKQQINVRRFHMEWVFFNAHEPKQQHYTCNIPRSLTHKSHQSCLVWGNHCNFKIFGDYRAAHRGSSTLTRTWSILNLRLELLLKIGPTFILAKRDLMFTFAKFKMVDQCEATGGELIMSIKMHWSREIKILAGNLEHTHPKRFRQEIPRTK